MPRSLDLVVESPSDVAQVHSAMRDADYWPARFAAVRPDTRLDSLTVQPDGSVTVTTTQDLRHQALPAVIANILPGDLKILGTEKWKPVDGGRVRGEITLSAARGMGCCRADAVIAQTKSGSQLRFTAAVRVKIPVFGGKIESFIGEQLAEDIRAVQRFTTAWITEHRCHST